MVQHRANRTISREPVLHSPDLKTMPHLTHRDLHFSAKSLFWPLCTDLEENALMHTNLAVALLPISQQSQCLLSLTLVSLIAWLWVSYWKISFSCWKSQWSLLAELRSYLPPPQSSFSLSFCSHLFLLFLLPSNPIPSPTSRKIIQKNKLDCVPSLLKTTPLASQDIELFFNMILKAVADFPVTNSPRSFSLLFPNCFQSSHPLAFFLLSFFVCTVFHLWRPLPYKLLYLMPTHLARLWSILFLLNTLLFSLWGFYSKHIAQPVINYLYVCFLLNGCLVYRMCEVRAFVHYQKTQILANHLTCRVG